MKNLLGLTLIFFGILLGIYVGGYICLFGGLVSIFDGLRHASSSVSLAWAVIKIIFASFFGGLTSLFLIIPGVYLLDE